MTPFHLFHDCGPRNCISEQKPLNLLPLLNLNFLAVITTTSRSETTSFSKSMGATYTVNHRDPLPLQIATLSLSIPLKDIFITHSLERYLALCTEIAALFAKVCSIVQARNMQMHGTALMAKSLCYVSKLLGTKPYYGVDVESHERNFREFARLVAKGRLSVICKRGRGWN